jgi:hypothetical protein
MDTQMTEAVAAKRAAIAKVRRNANPEWMQMMLGHVRAVATTTPEFTTDAVFDYAQRVASADDPVTHELRAMGAVMTRAAKEGFVVRTEAYHKSKRKSCHNRPLAVWRSLLT